MFPIIPANGANQYQIPNSLRLRSSASAYLSRTPASAGNRTMWTWSGWVKRGVLGATQVIFEATDAAGSTVRATNRFTSADTLDFSDSSSGLAATTTQVFRDPSAWYHFVVAIDTMQATASNRFKLYVNGVQVTSFSSITYPTQNANTLFNSTSYFNYLGATRPAFSQYFDGYLADVNFIDGQALTPTSFGYFDSSTGVWTPKKYSGSYGTNGFRLPFNTTNNNNLVAYYSGGKNGTSIINSGGSPNGTAGSGVTSVTGKVGNGFAFDGTVNAYVDTGILTSFSAQLSAAMWFKTTSSASMMLFNNVAYFADSWTNFPLSLQLASGVLTLSGSYGNDYQGDFTVTGGTGLNDDNWHHVAVTYKSATSATIYIDGVSAATVSITGTISASAYNWYLGRAAYLVGGGSPGNPFTGTIDDFRFYSTQLSAADIANIYNGVAIQSLNAVGSDNSGNGNDWTPFNIGTTPGVTYDLMLDSPTPFAGTGNGVGNYCTMNPLTGTNSASSYLSQANLYFVDSSNASNWKTLKGTIAIPYGSGKYYWEAVIPYSPSGAIGSQIGLVQANAKLTSDLGTYVLYWNGAGSYSIGATTYPNPALNDVLQVAYDAVNGQLWFGKNGTWFAGNPSAGTGASFTGITADMIPALAAYSLNASAGCAINFGQRPFQYTPPTGFKTLCTQNLPAPTIKAGNKHFDVSLWTGTNANQTIANGGGFQPDLIWVKSRSSALDNALIDAVRGVNKGLCSNSTAAETTSLSGYDVTSFNSNGFSLGPANTVYVNNNGLSYVGWQWKAGGTAVTNTAGSITSQVSANTTAGFSVVTYTGNGSSGATVGHGLGVAPAFIIIKDRTAARTGDQWPTYHVSIGATGGLVYLNSSGAGIAASTVWNNTNPSSSLFTLGNWGGINYSGDAFVAYCFAAIPGFSAFGSYTGNGSADGPFVYLGFRPRFVLIKRTDVVASWMLYDTARNTYNVTDLYLNPNSSSVEGSGITFPSAIDILSNGFKTRNYDATYGPNTNASGGTYIYAAFAENPFQNSLAR